MTKKLLRTNRGLMTIELLIAFGILLINITGVMLLVHQGQSVTLDNETATEAQAIAQGLIEKAQADAKFDFNLVNSSPATPDGIYTKETIVSSVEDDPDTELNESLFTKKVTSIVTWLLGENNYKSVLTSLVTNPEAVEGGDTCSSVLDEEEWKDPEAEIYEFGADILEGNGSTSDTSSGFPITSIQTFNGKMYVTVNNTNGNNNGTLFVLDISDPTEMPLYLSELDNNPGVARGLNSIAFDGNNRAFVAVAHTPNYNTCVNVDGTNLSCGQLQIIDLDDMSVDYTYKVPGVTGTSGQGVGNVVFYHDGIVYLGLSNSPGGPEFHTIDVSGSAPGLLDSAEIGNGVNSIFVKDDYAYVASPNNEELKIFDVSNPNSISEVGGYFAPGGGGVANGHGKSINLIGNTLYLGRTLITNQSELHVLDVTDPETNLPEIASMPVWNAASPSPENASVNGIIVRHNLVFLITKKEFQVWNFLDPLNPEEHASPITLPPGTGGGLEGAASDCEGNYIFVGSQSNNDKGYITVITGSQ